MLEPYEGKLSRTVLRGEGGSNTADLPDHLALKRDPFLESREKEDAFVKGIVEAVEQKVLDNLPGLAGMFMMQQQSLLSVVGVRRD